MKKTPSGSSNSKQIIVRKAAVGRQLQAARLDILQDQLESAFQHSPFVALHSALENGLIILFG
jgi:hypothetical protein